MLRLCIVGCLLGAVQGRVRSGGADQTTRVLMQDRVPMLFVADLPAERTAVTWRLNGQTLMVRLAGHEHDQVPESMGAKVMDRNASDPPFSIRLNLSEADTGNVTVEASTGSEVTVVAFTLTVLAKNVALIASPLCAPLHVPSDVSRDTDGLVRVMVTFTPKTGGPDVLVVLNTPAAPRGSFDLVLPRLSVADEGVYTTAAIFDNDETFVVTTLTVVATAQVWEPIDPTWRDTCYLRPGETRILDMGEPPECLDVVVWTRDGREVGRSGPTGEPLTETPGLSYRALAVTWDAPGLYGATGHWAGSTVTMVWRRVVQLERRAPKKIEMTVAPFADVFMYCDRASPRSYSTAVAWYREGSDDKLRDVSTMLVTNVTRSGVYYCIGTDKYRHSVYTVTVEPLGRPVEVASVEDIIVPNGANLWYYGPYHRRKAWRVEVAGGTFVTLMQSTTGECNVGVFLVPPSGRVSRRHPGVPRCVLSTGAVVVTLAVYVTYCVWY